MNIRISFSKQIEQDLRVKIMYEVNAAGSVFIESDGSAGIYEVPCSDFCNYLKIKYPHIIRLPVA